ncbi:aldehyde dehydrogenase family protein [Modestobacter sp. I12A-02662]|uniref:aldehyde dehydrogenase family protein n=1 Tax=Modestobacter sp. I12A-02662 TaxID=1730496 RepID=UPI0034DFF561
MTTTTPVDLSALTPLIGGEPYRPGDDHDVIEPATGNRLTGLPETDRAGIDAAVSAARRALPGWAGLPPRDRASHLLRLADAFEAATLEMGELEARDVGKPLADARAEMGSAADKYRFFAGAARTMTAAATGEYKPGLTSLVRREPIGVVAALTPWNYPMGLTSWKIGPALAAGNTVVLKPPLEASLTSLLLARIAQDVLPPGVLNVITGSGPGTGATLAAHPGVDMVSLTGGTETGKAVMRLAADCMKRVHLELGGKAPVVVFDDADLEKFARVVKGAVFRNSGQDCTAATRVYVSEARRDDVLDVLRDVAESMVVGNGFLDPQVDMGPVVSHRHRDRIAGFVEGAVRSSGATVVTGATVPDSPGAFYAPTVLTGVQQGDEIVQTELFGPVVTVSTFSGEDDAVAQANDVRYGLAASVWTRDIDRAMAVSAQLQAGTVWVNEHGPTAAEMPFGGYKQSGVGRDLSIHAVEQHTNLKHVAIGHGRSW